MKTLNRLLLVILLFSPLNGLSASDSAIAERANVLMQEFFSSNNTPGLAVSVGLGDEIVWSAGFGHSDVEQMVKVDPARTLFRIGSVIKPMTAHAAAQLVAAGKLDLDVPVQVYVPGFPEKRAPITTRLLLAHLAGIRHYQGNEFLSRVAYATTTAGLEVFKHDPLLHAPGERYRYSSYGYNLVGAVIEGASGEDYLAYMSKHVFAPLSMENTVPDFLAQLIPGRGRYYYRDGDVLFNTPEVDNSYKWASGGYIGSADDLVRFGLAQLQDNPFNELVHREFWARQVTNDGSETNYGLGWIIRTDESATRWVGHGGGSIGGTTQFWIQPDSGLVIAMISNLSDFKYGAIVSSLGEVFLSGVE